MLFHPGCQGILLYSCDCQFSGDTEMAVTIKEKRAHKRVDVAQAIFIEIAGRKRRSESENTIIRCETVNVSVGGLKILMPLPVPPGSRLNIAVPQGDWEDSLELTGEAVWTKPVEDGPGHWVGLRLDDTDRDSMEKWFWVVHSLSSKTGT